MQRYFGKVINQQAFLNDADIHHFSTVMRGKVGEQIEVVDNSHLFLCEAKSFNPLILEVIKEIDNNSELPYRVTLFYALAKGDKIEFVIQKATELGVSNIVLFSSSRCIVKMNNDDFLRKKKRYDLIMKEASEQSHRLKIPAIQGVFDINQLPKEFLASQNYVAYEGCASYEKPTFLVDSDVSILIGPEGGISKEEINSLIKQGFKPISLGKRILRTETAAVYALSVIDNLLER